MKVQIQINIDDRIASALKKVFARRNLFVAAIALGLVSTAVYAASVTNTFSDGDPLSADKMNENFSNLANDVTTLEGKSWSGSNTSNLHFTGGNVGIGTANPGQRLTVTNGDDAQIRIYSNGGSVGVIDTVANTNSAQDRWLSINPTGGNVGIGTGTPSAKLDVQGGDFRVDTVKLGSADYGGTSRLEVELGDGAKWNLNSDGTIWFSPDGTNWVQKVFHP